MKVSDYIVNYLINKGITDVFGYPGGMVTHLMESFRKYRELISAHATYHEQGAAFAACGYAQASGKPGVAYATSGPGATNLLTGICDAYFDSIPSIFITGQVNSFETKGDLGVRQRGFQETEIVSMVKGVTKYSTYVETPEKIKYYLDRAFYEATSGRPGPVLLDIPMNVFRSNVEVGSLIGFTETNKDIQKIKLDILFEDGLNKSKFPVIILGNGIKISRAQKLAREVIEKIQIPVVTSMIAFDAIAECEWNYGFVGAYGNREANFLIAKSDLIISIGTRMDVRQVGMNRKNFAPNARIIRIDIDSGEFSYKVHENEEQVCCSAKEALKALGSIQIQQDYTDWRKTCNLLKQKLNGIDMRKPNKLVYNLSRLVPEKSIITTDVGQNQVWIAQSFLLREDQEVLFSGGHGAMGYSLPAAIGAYYGCGKKPVYSISGDGGFQMNIQELQFIAREKIPIKMIVLNNNALGMIRHFQEMYFDSEFFQTKPECGYNAPSFTKIASAYGIRSLIIHDVEDLGDLSMFEDTEPLLIEVMIDENTYVFPKLEFGKPNQDQEPLLERDLYNRLMEL